MSNLLTNVQITLSDASFETWVVEGLGSITLGFEDEVTMGFVSLFDSADQLLANWRQSEGVLLGRYAPNLKAAGEKAWNVYMVFLTSDVPDPNQARSIRWIDENLDRTRKIAAGGVQTREDSEAALLPLLPILSKPLLNIETSAERLARRLQIIAPDVMQMIFDEDVPAKDVAATLGGSA